MQHIILSGLPGSHVGLIAKQLAFLIGAPFVEAITTGLPDKPPHVYSEEAFFYQQLRLGADVSIHSTTKYMDGQGRTLGGMIVGRQEVIDRIAAFARHSGPAMSPFNAWVISKSLETLSLRMQQHSRQAMDIAQRLEAHAAVAAVRYPFLASHPQAEVARRQMAAGGGMLSFELKGGLAAGRRLLDRLQLFSLTANLGDTRSIATHPASTTHARLKPEERQLVGITDGLVRLSIGLEHVEDLWADLEMALGD